MCWGRSLTNEPRRTAGTGSGTIQISSRLALPESTLLEQQAGWLAPARAQLLRRVHIARRRRVLDLGTGYGAVVPELVRRAGERVVALDRVWGALREQSQFAGAARVAGDAVHLPLISNSLDLVFSQLTLLWITPLTAAIAEIWRALMPGGDLVALEPDYGGMIEYPTEIESRPLWLAGLQRAGADPYVGRKLPGLLARQGFRVSVSLFDTLFEPDLARFVFLRDLPLTDEERNQLAQIEQRATGRLTPSMTEDNQEAGAWRQLAHLPFFLVRATKP
jgi:SAM-dependent methyltransferase